MPIEPNADVFIEVTLTLRVAYADPEAAKVAIERWVRGDGPRPWIQDFVFEGESE